MPEIELIEDETLHPGTMLFSEAGHAIIGRSGIVFFDRASRETHFVDGGEPYRDGTLSPDALFRAITHHCLAKSGNGGVPIKTTYPLQ